MMQRCNPGGVGALGACTQSPAAGLSTAAGSPDHDESEAEDDNELELRSWSPTAGDPTSLASSRLEDPPAPSAESVVAGAATMGMLS